MSDPSEDRAVHAPHPPLTRYYRGEEGRRPFVRRMFDAAAGDYDRVERMMAFGTGRWYRRQALLRAGLDADMRVLDVAVGTGLVAREAAAIVGDPHNVVGLDLSAAMLHGAVASLDILAVQAAAESLPFATAEFDFLSMGFALRHMADLSTVFAEFLRALRPGGTVCVLEITRPAGSWSRLALKGYMRGVVPVLARSFGRRAETAELMRYYWDTIDACVPPERVLGALEAAGFEAARRNLVLGIFSEYTARKPS